MPSLVAFGHKWGIGSDDLAIPAAIEATASATWLFTYGRLFSGQFNTLPNLPGGPTVQRLIIMGTVLNTCNLVVLGFMLKLSFKGTVINSGPRCGASRLLGLKLLSGGVSVGLSVEAVRLLYTSVLCDLTSTAPLVLQTLRHTARGLWAVTAVSAVVLWHILNPYKRKPHIKQRVVHDLETTESAKEIIRCSWKERFHSLGKFLGIEGHPALNKIGKLFSEYFQEENDLDLVATDVIAALMVLSKQQEIKFERYARNSPGLGLTLPAPPLPQPWMTVPEAAHYMKYAAGTYGWPMYIWSSPLAMWGLVRVLIRSRYLPRTLPDNVIDDNPLMANTTVIKMVTGLDDKDLVLVNFHNKLFEVPFYVALDHEKRAVVVAIRGTLSLEDILTDLSAYDDRHIDIEGVSDASSHEGMYHSAEYIYRKLLGLDSKGEPIETGLLEKTQREGKAKDYRLVIVGHSLGAGVAAVLAIFLHQHPKYGQQMQCFAYSPPGGLLSLSASQYAEKFVCSVVLGDDLVPRLGILNLYNLKIDMLRTIQQLDQPKGALQSAIDNNQSKIVGHKQMFPPGVIMYVERSPDKQRRENFTATYVPSNSHLFQEIVLSKTVVSDHTPWAVLSSLRLLAQQQLNKDKEL